ncbi:response regulator [Allocoleopsis sp.]|uniref:response regulator n=1 Tax=Allocoleopsis sp. TaxID=3088169 RepID=UPI002FD6F45F
MKSQETSKPKLLVVDDEPDNLDLLYRTFHREYKVLRADNGPAALEILAKEGDVAVIISDQRMPLMSGVEFLALTATQYPDIIRIILTGYTDVEDLVEAINAGKVFKFVTKPWNSDDLKAVVKQAMDTHNVLKVRTRELCRALRRESLLNTVTNTIRNAQFGQDGDSPLQQILQRIVESVGHLLEVDICLLRPFQNGRLVDEWFVYQKSQGSLRSGAEAELNGSASSGEATAKREESVTRDLDMGAGEHDRGNSTVFASPRLPSLASSSSPSSSFSQSPIPHPPSPRYPLLLEQTVWETRDVEVINDVLTDERFMGEGEEIQRRAIAYQQTNIRSTLVVPLISQQELVAVLALHQCDEPYYWQDDEIQLVVMVADQAALALSQARAYEQVRALATQQALVNTITNAIRSTLDPQEIFTAITQQLGQAIKVDGCTLSLWREEDEFVQCVGLYDGKSAQVVESQDIENSNASFINQSSNSGSVAHQLPQSLVPISGNPVLQQLVNTQQPVAIDDLAANPEMKGFDLPFRKPARALLVVPLLADSASSNASVSEARTTPRISGQLSGRIIGSITLRHTYRPRHWLPSEINLAQAVAAQAAIAVQQSRLYQKTRQQAERLMELDRQKTEFFQNISHEFRTPLTLMIGPLESVIERQQDLPYEQSVIALRNSRRLLRLVNQLLDLHRLDAGRMQASFRPCSLVEFVSQIVEAFRPYCDKKNIRLSTQLTRCPAVYLDLEKFDKVLYNVLSNAMKFTDPGGSITVKVEPAGDHVRLQITDTGIGIKKEQVPHLFERFRQAEGSVNRSYEGSGLGLALVKELVELHGGQISVESVYSEGTTFNVWLQTGTSHLPVEQVLEVPTEIQSSRAAVELADLEIEFPVEEEEQETGEPQPKVAGVSSSSAPSQVLVVDDNPDLRAYVSRILRQEGHHVRTARNGAEGFQSAQEYRPQLIVADLMMPEVSGLDMIRMIRETPELEGTPIILLTAKADEATRIEGAEQGATAYLSKPFNDRELLAEVRNLLALKANEQRVLELNTYLTESVLRRFLPPAMVQRAARGELELDLSPEPRLITTLFSDIVGFTQMSNTLRSRRVAELLNEYLAEMTKAVFDNGGTVDKFMGDGILAIFGAPEELTPQEQVRRAVATARQMLYALHQLNQRWQEQGIVGENGPPPVRFRCGIHQGTAVVGMFGGKERSDYTAIGPSVNIASRLQEAAEPNSILVSANVADWLDDDEITRFRPLTLKGVDETVLTFSVKPMVRNPSKI